MKIRSLELETVCGITSILPENDKPEIAFAGKSNVGKSSLINALLNRKIGLLLKKDNFTSFAIRSYVSTFIAQFVDNLTFATVVSKVFFGWTWTQIFACSIVAACFELFCEVIFSKLGYKITKSWQKENVGQEYIDLQK